MIKRHYLTFYEVIMAKRPNPKKEKAERNKAYARKFRKQTSRFSSSRGRSYNNNFQKKEETNNSNTDS